MSSAIALDVRQKFRPKYRSKKLENEKIEGTKIDPLQIRQAAISPSESSEIRETGDFRSKLIANSVTP